MAPNGTLVLVGAPSGLWQVLPGLLKAHVLSHFGSRRIAPFLARVTHDDLVALKDLVEAGRLSPVIDRPYLLSEVPGAIRYVGTREARGKVVISVI